MQVENDSSRPLIDEERPFAIDELFFSTTDQRGIIRSGNGIFARVSGYALEEMLGRPHNLIRHPHMPRVVFKLLWDELLAGRAIAAYVKNLARDGRYYWVVATATPCEGGFISVRFKPSTPTLAAIDGVYSELRAIEAEVEAAGRGAAAAMEASGRRLGEVLKSLGFKDYASFMHTFMPAELVARADALAAGSTTRATSSSDDGTPLARVDATLSSLLAGLAEFADLNAELVKKSVLLLELGRQVRLASTNALTASRRIGSEGAALAVTADILAGTTTHGTNLVSEIAEGLDGSVESLRRLAFEVSVAGVQVECALAFERESSNDGEAGIDRSADRSTLCETVESSIHTLVTGLTTQERDFAHLQDIVGEFVTTLRTLEMIHMTGKIEAERLRSLGLFNGRFDVIIDQVVTARREMIVFIETIEKTRSRLATVDRQGLIDDIHSARTSAVALI